MMEMNIRILQAGHALIEPHWWKFSLRPSRFWTMYLANRTGTVLTLGQKTLRLPAQRVCLIPMGLNYDCHVTRDVKQAWFTFDLVSPASALMRQLFDGVSVLKENGGMQARVSALAAELDFSSPITFELGIKVKSLVYEAMAAHLAGLEPGRLNAWEKAGGRPEISGALKLIEEQMAGPLDNSTLSAACHMSEFHFIRKFTATMGETPARYVRDRRISKAAQLLAFSSRSIKEIAQEVGFADRFHMSRVFRQLTGKTPAKYRRETGY